MQDILTSLGVSDVVHGRSYDDSMQTPVVEPRCHEGRPRTVARAPDARLKTRFVAIGPEIDALLRRFLDCGGPLDEAKLWVLLAVGCLKTCVQAHAFTHAGMHIHARTLMHACARACAHAHALAHMELFVH